jgi:hypothetical protein
LPPRDGGDHFNGAVEGAIRNSFMHSLLAKGCRLLYTHEESITDLFARLQGIGERNTQLQVLCAAEFGAHEGKQIPKASDGRVKPLRRSCLRSRCLLVGEVAGKCARLLQG